MTKEKKDPVIELERGAPDRLVPKDFGDILMTRYFPVLSLTYISTIIGIAAKKHNLILYVFEDKTAYVMALLVALWVSIPAILWIILKGAPQYRDHADDWYKITVAIMMVFMILSYVLFPEADVFGMRIYFAASIPVLFIMYWFFVKGGLPKVAAYPLSVLGLTFLIYGAVLNMLH
jgi:O-antigen/teichoic acid export membrane protein